MKSAVLILCSGKPDQSDLSFAGLVDFMGLNREFISLKDYPVGIGPLADIAKDNDQCLALNCGTLVAIHSNRGTADAFKSLLRDRLSFLFVYNISPGGSQNEALSYLTGGAIMSVSSFPSNDYQYEVSKDFKEISRQFSGLSFGPINNTIDFGLGINEQKKVGNLISIGKQPLFLRTKEGKCEIFALANGILDVHDHSFGLKNIREYFSRIMPAMMFLRYVFKEYCWHNDNAQACLIIDDPSLARKRYGFLDYETLLVAMDRHNFFTSIAFIPWNFRRTSREVANLLKKRADRFSICVHGCDHIKREFGSTDYLEVNNNVKQATGRMKSHEEASGLAFDKVMVFPHEAFSTHSMKVLKSNNYLAAVSNSTPTNWSDHQMTGSLLQPAIMDYENFALFHRRPLGKYPDEIVDFAFDLFLGKPVILFVHHDFLRAGYGKIVESVKRVNSLGESIRWKNLEGIAKNSFLRKQENNGTISIRQYASTLVVSNTANKVMKYVITKEEAGDVPVKDVLVNGEKAPYQIVDNVLKIAIDVGPGKIVEIKIIYQDIFPRVKEKNRRRKMKAFVIRHISEIRDNYISKNQPLLSIVNKMSKFVK